VLTRRDVAAGLVIFVAVVFATSVRTRSSRLASGGSLLGVASADDRTWYLAVVASMVLGAVSSATYFEAGRFEYAWAAGGTMVRQLAARTACGLFAGAACATLYWAARTASAAASLLLVGSGLAGGHGDPPVAWGFAARLVLVCVLVGGLGAAVGVAVQRTMAAAGVALALVVTVLPVFDLVAIRFPGLVRLQSFVPGGAVTTVLESNAGLARSAGLLNLRSGRPPSVGLLLLGAWAGALLVTGVVRRRRASASDSGVQARVVSVVGSAVAVVVLAAMVLPVLARDALPWFMRPDWLYDSRHHRSSIDAVEDFVAKLRRGEAPVGAIDPADPVWRPLRTGVVDIATEREMDGPEAVPVVVTEPGTSGWRYTYDFTLARDDGGWEVVRVRAGIG
jgi:hypothetical protein